MVLRETDSITGKACVFTTPSGIGNWTEQTILTASDGATGDPFGISVAVAGDTVVIGAWSDDTTTRGGTDSGGVEAESSIFCRAAFFTRLSLWQGRISPCLSTLADKVTAKRGFFRVIVYCLRHAFNFH